MKNRKNNIHLDMKNMDFKYKMNKKVSKKHSDFDEKNKKFLPEMWKSQKI